jgi:hypothetical protein
VETHNNKRKADLCRSRMPGYVIAFLIQEIGIIPRNNKYKK